MEEERMAPPDDPSVRTVTRTHGQRDNVTMTVIGTVVALGCALLFIPLLPVLALGYLALRLTRTDSTGQPDE
jgi:hypothetical protein